MNEKKSVCSVQKKKHIAYVWFISAAGQRKREITQPKKKEPLETGVREERKKCVWKNEEGTTSQPASQTDRYIKTIKHLSLYQCMAWIGFNPKNRFFLLLSSTLRPRHICESAHTHAQISSHVSSDRRVKNGKMMIRDNYGLMVIEQATRENGEKEREQKRIIFYSLSSFYYMRLSSVCVCMCVDESMIVKFESSSRKIISVRWPYIPRERAIHLYVTFIAWK